MNMNGSKIVERPRKPRAPTGNLYAAIDIGTTKVCTLLARVAAGGELEIVSVGIAQSAGMHKALVVDMDAMQEAIRRSWVKATTRVGQPVTGACIGVTGSHIVSTRTTGVVTGLNTSSNQLITRQDMRQAVRRSVPKVDPRQEVLHVIPLSYTLDSVHGIRNPAGLMAHDLSVESHAVIGEAASLENVVRAVEGAGVRVSSMVLEPLASAEAVLTADEREMGVVLVDIGGGTTDIAIFQHGLMAHTAVIPVAGYQFTNDVAIGLGVTYEAAEEAKLCFGNLLFDDVSPTEIVDIPGSPGQRALHVCRRDLCRLLNDRATELVRMIRMKIKQAGLGAMPPGGVVYTGGGANLPGLEQVTHEYLPGPVRIAQPRDIPGLPAELKSPTFSTSIGILLWGIYHPVEQQEYRYHENAAHTFHNTRHWLRWLAQFMGARKAFT